MTSPTRPSTLSISLAPPPAQFTEGDAISFKGTYRNTGEVPYSLTFWWNRRIRVTDSSGKVMVPGPGPVLPSGIQESSTPLAVGGSIERIEPLACTQPAGRSEAIGWSYTLPPGAYRAVLHFAFPPAHGLRQTAADSWSGEVESNSVEFTVAPRPSLFERIFGRRSTPPEVGHE
jgi:hypothetical protein